MKLYDGESAIDWFYDGTRTAEEMRFMPEYEQLFQEPCVLQDDGDGRVYSFVTLADLCMKLAVPYNAAPEKLFESCVASDKGTYKAPGVEQAEATAEEAKEIASQAGTDPQLQALATLQISTMSFDSTPSDEVVKFIDYWPDWKPDTAYKHNDPLTYQGRKFRASKDLTSQVIYPPGTAESEYYEVTLAPDGIIIWYQPGGAYNQIYKGEKRHYPDADSPVYEALEDTTYSPDAYPQHWKLVEGQKE